MILVKPAPNLSKTPAKPAQIPNSKSSKENVSKPVVIITFPTMKISALYVIILVKHARMIKLMLVLNVKIQIMFCWFIVVLMNVVLIFFYLMTI